jgi:hypothetical protein
MKTSLPLVLHVLTLLLCLWTEECVDGQAIVTTAVCTPTSVGARRGLCNASSGITFFHLDTLPSGGPTAAVKAAGTVPGNTEEGSFFFGIGVGVVAEITPTGVVGTKDPPRLSSRFASLLLHSPPSSIPPLIPWLCDFSLNTSFFQPPPPLPPEDLHADVSSSS